MFLDMGLEIEEAISYELPKKFLMDPFFNYEKPALVASPTTCAYIITFYGCGDCMLWVCHPWRQ